MKKTTLALMEYGNVTQDTEGNVQKDWITCALLTGVLLPITSELANKKYGYSENVSYQFFYKGSHDNLVSGNMLGNYIICHVADYDRAKVVLLQKEVK